MTAQSIGCTHVIQRYTVVWIDIVGTSVKVLSVEISVTDEGGEVDAVKEGNQVEDKGVDMRSKACLVSLGMNNVIQET